MNTIKLTPEIYEKMRMWENTVKIRRDILASIRQCKSKDYVLSDEDKFRYGVKSIEEKVDLLKKELQECEEYQKQISDELEDQGIDVEYIVTSAYNDLKRGAWLFNYYIEENKEEHGKYFYKTYLHDIVPESEKESYDTLEQAVNSIMSFYDYQEDDTKQRHLQHFYDHWG